MCFSIIIYAILVSILVLHSYKFFPVILLHRSILPICQWVTDLFLLWISQLPLPSPSSKPIEDHHHFVLKGRKQPFIWPSCALRIQNPTQHAYGLESGHLLNTYHLKPTACLLLGIHIRITQSLLSSCLQLGGRDREICEVLMQSVVKAITWGICTGAPGSHGKDTDLSLRDQRSSPSGNEFWRDYSKS